MAKFHLLPLAIGAAVGVGAYVLSKYLNRDEEGEHIVEDEAFDEAAGTQTAEPAQPAAEPAPESAAPEEPEPEQPAAGEPKGPIQIPIEDGDDTPNANPVKDATEPAKVGEDGKVDPTTIARPEDFENWDETGCKG
ncbi:hypothetical protein [Gemmiger sp.]|uniref:hypothetical protein n=1 Tax=Gemmiger sp. TaxID=2049027 RepID=UPI003F089F55